MKHTRNSLPETIINSIRSSQQSDGSFLTDSFSQNDFGNEQFVYKTTFATSLILQTISQLDRTHSLQRIQRKGASFLLSQRSDNWSWNYWAKDTTEARVMAYPDDLDDTFNALSALCLYDKSLLDGGAMASVVQLLTVNEQTEGGPYRTWLVNKKTSRTWQDVDFAVNCNIAYFLFLQEIELPKLSRFIDIAITKKNFNSRYYPTSYPCLYFLSRFYQGKQKTIIIEYLLKKRDNHHRWENPLFTALALSSLLNLGVSAKVLAPSINYLVREGREEIYKPYPFCIDPSRDGKEYVLGAAALTAAFYLEALSLYEKKKRVQNQTFIPQEEQSSQFYHQITHDIQERLEPLNTKMRRESLSLLKQLLAKDTEKQIALLPYYFSSTLGEKRKDIAPSLLVNLGVANVFGWLAYTIYDDFLDGSGNPQRLPIANIALREVTKIFENLLPETELTELFHNTMDEIDYANFWEVINCRYFPSTKTQITEIAIPNFRNLEQLAQKSCGHMLGPLTLLLALGYNYHSTEIKYLTTFFKHYLIVKQLNDDAHDWENDLKQGQITAVGGLLLKRLQMNPPKKHYHSIEKYIPQLQKLFWYEVIGDVATLSEKHTRKALIALKKCTMLNNTASLEKLLMKQSGAIATALTEQKKAIQFLKQYHS